MTTEYKESWKQFSTATWITVTQMSEWKAKQSEWGGTCHTLKHLCSDNIEPSPHGSSRRCGVRKVKHDLTAEEEEEAEERFQSQLSMNTSQHTSYLQKHYLHNKNCG